MNEENLGMKTCFIMLTFCIISVAKAEMSTINCSSTLGTDHNLVLITINHSLKQIRIPNFMDNGFKALVPNKLPNQCFEGKTLYAIANSKSMIEVENKVLDSESGQVRLDEEIFNCNE